MPKKTKGERLLAKLNQIEATELEAAGLQLARPKRGPLTKGGIPTDVARGLKGARRPMPPRPAGLGRDRAQEVLDWYLERVGTVFRRDRLNAATAAMLRQELNERAAELSDAEYGRLRRMLDEVVKKKGGRP